MNLIDYLWDAADPRSVGETIGEKEETESEMEQVTCWCRKCGEPVQCEHANGEPHVESLCGADADMQESN